MNKLLFLISSFISFSLCGMEQRKDDSMCCGLDNAFYSVASRMGRNDFLHLAHTNCTWFLQKKIMRGEHRDDLDKYYVGLGFFYNGIECTIFHTPLHEAIDQGNLASVKLLYRYGADIHKKIKSINDIQDSERADETRSLRLFYGSIWGPGNTLELITNFKKEHFVGLSALMLALEKADKPASYDSPQKINERKAIYEFLNEQACKNKQRQRKID